MTEDNIDILSGGKENLFDIFNRRKMLEWIHDDGESDFGL